MATEKCLAHLLDGDNPTDMTPITHHSGAIADDSLDPVQAAIVQGDKISSASPQKSAVHYDWLDGLRVLAIIDIVGKHSIGAEAGYFRDGIIGIVSTKHPFSGVGLPIFILCTIALTAKRSEPRPIKQMVYKKATRLLIPWLLWSAFYVLFNLRRARLRGESFTDIYSVEELLLFGGTLGLWYLIFAFVAESLVNAVQHGTKWFERQQPKVMAMGWLALGTMLISIAPYMITYAEKHTWIWYVQHTWIVGMLLVPVGLGLGLLLRENGNRLFTRICLYGFGFTFIVLSTVNLNLIGTKMHVIIWQGRVGFALVLISIALSIRRKMPQWLVFLGTYTFTIYLVHFFIIAQFENRITGIIGDDKPWLYFGLVWLLSLIAAIVLKKLPVVKRYC